jgi:class 3 adenylate cyclase
MQSDVVVKAERQTIPFGFLAYLGAGASIVACFATAVMTYVTSLLGLTTIGVNPHLQAVIMWIFGLVAVVGLVRDRNNHDQTLPAAIGIVGLAVIVVTLYTFYDPLILLFGYVFLVVAAFLNQNLMLGKLNQTVEQQAGELRELNRTLEDRVELQVDEIERLDRLKRFLAPEIADLITSTGKESMLDSHRSYIATLFCDIRDFTALSERIEPEDVMNVLQGYHERLGRLVAQHQGTIGYRAGDGLMVFFNDPIPCEDPVLKAVNLAMDMRDLFNDMKKDWVKSGFRLGFGVGVASGYATLGVVGFEGCYDYTAIGNAVNLSSRLCDKAKDGQILIDQRSYGEVGRQVKVKKIGALEMKGIGVPIETYSVVSLVAKSQSRQPKKAKRAAAAKR